MAFLINSRPDRLADALFLRLAEAVNFLFAAFSFSDGELRRFCRRFFMGQFYNFARIVRVGL